MSVKLTKDEGLNEILARVETATGADRELDRELMALSYKQDRRYIGCRCDPSCCPGSAHLDTVWVDPATDRWTTTSTTGFEFTTSLDAALALCERALAGTVPPPREDMPLWLPKVARWFNGRWEATLYRSTDGFKAEASAATPALALLAAMLRALIANPGRDA